MDKNKQHPSRDPKSIKKDRLDKHAPKRHNTDTSKSLDWTSQLADEWEISENSMLIPDLGHSDYLTRKELDNIIDESTSEDSKHSDNPNIPSSAKQIDELRDKLSQTEPPSNKYSSQSLSKPKPPNNQKAKSESSNPIVHSKSRKAAENLITSLTESISGTKNTKVPDNLEFNSTARAKENTIRGDKDLVPSETADFPTSRNPFKQATNNALLDIAKSENTSEATLLWLSENNDATIRRAVAGNQHSSKQILARLIKDYDGQVRLAALDNPSLTPDLVVELLSDTNPLVSLRAYEVLNELRKQSGLKPIANKSQVNTVNDLPSIKPDSEGQLSASKKPTTANSTEEVIMFLRMIAEKHSTPTQRLSELASHKDTLVRAAVAKNARSPIDVLWSLLHDSEPLVKQNLIKNECSPVELLWALKDDPDKLVSQEAYKELKKLQTNQ